MVGVTGISSNLATLATTSSLSSVGLANNSFDTGMLGPSLSPFSPSWVVSLGPKSRSGIENLSGLPGSQNFGLCGLIKGLDELSTVQQAWLLCIWHVANQVRKGLVKN
jgi:hypothetical protein